MVLSEKWHFTESVPLLPVSGGASERLCLYSCFRWHLRASVPLLPVSGGDSGRLCLYFLFQTALHGICASTSCFNNARDELTRGFLHCMSDWKIFLLAIHMHFTFTKHNSEISINLFIIYLTIKVAVKDPPPSHPACISLTEKTDFQNMEF